MKNATVVEGSIGKASVPTVGTLSGSCAQMKRRIRSLLAVPSDFPLNYGEFTQSSPESYDNMVQNKVVGGSINQSLAGTRPPYVYVHLDGNYGFHDKLLYCEDDQQFLQGVPWLIMQTDMYFIPSLFLIPAYYEDELAVTKYYRFYLAKAEKREKYNNLGTVDGTTVKVYQPSHEEYQRSRNKKHNMKALAEIYLLSMTDAPITSGFSTFEYAAQRLAGVTPWIMFRSENHVTPDPPCRHVMSMEPCFHQAPYYDCKAKRERTWAR
ncbi:hypothetical protein PR202_ga02877 [Eleusine coracana subsp. coracana]|uniref:Fucosyltransferase n=1 Tax=Eleusine coracana subsp. coracana TaxID=191504 RepID=A0AAV5BKL5_ELECO|nr:hypothetical protein PR202_ga02877 [Eleusine coracana subsp. coracana]